MVFASLVLFFVVALVTYSAYAYHIQTVEYQIDKAKEYAANGSYAEAIACLEAAYEKNPEEVDLLFMEAERLAKNTNVPASRGPSTPLSGSGTVLKQIISVGHIPESPLTKTIIPGSGRPLAIRSPTAIIPIATGLWIPPTEIRNSPPAWQRNAQKAM